MAHESDKIMFEIYREAGFNRRYRVVYFTELEEHNKEYEINAAMAGDHVYDGFILLAESKQAKQVIDQVLARMNNGETVTSEQIEAALADYLPA